MVQYMMVAHRSPTEDRVKEMLKGTSHKPDELLTLKYPSSNEQYESVDRKKKVGR